MYLRMLFFSSLVLFVGVAMGAFGAHGLRGLLSEDSMRIYQTAVSYQMWHGLGLGLIAVLMRDHSTSKLLVWAGRLMLAGIVLFSGSLYGLSITGIRWLGMVTPFGGIAFLLAWLLLVVYSLRSAESRL